MTVLYTFLYYILAHIRHNGDMSLVNSNYSINICLNTNLKKKPTKKQVRKIFLVFIGSCIIVIFEE